MEGYLLALTKDRSAQLWFCVLEHGVLRCLTKPNGALVAAVQLTRHSVRVVVHADGVCPNEFAVCAVAVQFDEARAKLRLQRDKERVHRFAAPTPEKMRKWGRAIHNWKRYAFIEPTLATADSEATTAPVSNRRAALREEAQTLISFVTSFDLRLTEAVPSRSVEKKTTNLCVNFRSSMVSSSSTTATTTPIVQDKRQRHSLPAGRTSGTSQPSGLASWIPVIVPSWRRMWSSPSQE